jgi:hypothetical protein
MVAAQVLDMAPLTDENIPQFMEALAVLYSAYPDLNDAGFNGYGTWNVKNYAPVVLNYTTGYSHALAIMGETVSKMQDLFAATAAKLESLNGTSLYISLTYYSFETYASYYSTLSGGLGPVGAGIAFGSRLLDRAALTHPDLPTMLNITAGTYPEFVVNSFCLVGGGRVFEDASDPYSGVQPGWRTSYIHNIVYRGWAAGASEEEITAIHDDVTNVKVEAMRRIAPDTGCYMNEADRLDPNYLVNFYGGNLGKLQKIKGELDSLHVFYCPTCVGSESWKEEESGRLCRVS